MSEGTYDAVLLLAFGGPEGMDDVRPFLERVTRGRSIPPARLDAVAAHYAVFGGVSPINRITEAQRAALEAHLAARPRPLPVHVGQRHHAPFIDDALRSLSASGARRVLGLILTAHDSPAGKDRYRDAVRAACAALGPRAPSVDFAGSFHLSDGFVTANAEHLAAALETLSAPEHTRVLFTAHSIPTAMAAASPYEAELAQTAEAVRERLGLSDTRIVYQSRSGSPREPWLGPDVLDAIRQAADEGIRAVAAAPIGFVADHVEVLHDLDVEAADCARSLGLQFARARTAGDHPAFIEALSALIPH